MGVCMDWQAQGEWAGKLPLSWKHFDRTKLLRYHCKFSNSTAAVALCTAGMVQKQRGRLQNGEDGSCLVSFPT